MLKLGEVRRLLRDRRGVSAVIVAITLPITLVAVAVGAETAFIQVQRGKLQAAADSAAGAGRQAMNPYIPGQQASAVNAARLYANGNVPSSLAATDVVQGWWDIKTQSFGNSTTGQTGALFNNAVQVTTRLNHSNMTGRLLFPETVALAKKSIGYKCSNLDYPLTLIPDDENPPVEPTVWLEWIEEYEISGTHDNGSNDKDNRWKWKKKPKVPTVSTSYIWKNQSGRENPVIKFFSPTDGDDVSFVLEFKDGNGAPLGTLQMDTYCRGTFLIVPDAFDWKNKKNVTATVKRGSTNNSFELKPDQAKWPTYVIGTFSRTGTVVSESVYLRKKEVHTTPYPSSRGIQYWVSEGNPTPDRRTILVQQTGDL